MQIIWQRKAKTKRQKTRVLILTQRVHLQPMQVFTFAVVVVVVFVAIAFSTVVRVYRSPKTLSSSSSSAICPSILMMSGCAARAASSCFLGARTFLANFVASA